MAEASHFFLCGIGGSGMTPLALVLRARGQAVSGSDRSFDQGQNQSTADLLRARGIRLFAQDGSGLAAGATVLAVSSAIEPEVPDVAAALARQLPVRRRAELLRDVFQAGPAVAVGGTSGKTTVTGMLGHVLREAGRDPTVINGGVMLNSTAADAPGNAWCGSAGCCVIEADESDGTIELYAPDVAVLTTVSLDHQPLPELRRLFGDFLGRARVGAVVGADCAEALALAGRARTVLTFGVENAAATLNALGIEARPDGITFTLATPDGGPRLSIGLRVPGRHNVRNALAALGAAALLGVPWATGAGALAGFRGIHRRLELVGTSPRGVTVIDDFAHNPEKIAAALATLTEFPGRLLVCYQPHGFAPTRLLKDGLIAAFAAGLRPADVVLLPEIYFAGGTTTQDISAADLAAGIVARGRQAEFTVTRAAAQARLAALARPGDRVVVMGARDPSLAEFARALAASL